MKYALSIVAAILLLLAVFIYLDTPQEAPTFVPIQLPDDLPPVHNPTEAEILVNKINEINEKINSIECNLQITLQSLVKTKLNGFLVYEKPRNFHMGVFSRLSQEIDLGSNDKIFWFWSNHFNNSIVYYAKYENLMQTRLKTPFHPLWIKESLGLDPIEIKGTDVVKYGNKIGLIKKKVSTEGSLVTKITILDPARNRMVGNYLYDLNGRLIVSSEITEFYDNLYPKIIKIIWVEEQVVLEIHLLPTRVNNNIDPKQWQIPQIRGVVKYIELGV